MIPREPNVVTLSDASYSGLGGWLPTWKFMWRLTREELLAFGFNMRNTDKAGEDLLMYEQDCPDALLGLHINVLDLVAIVINTWIILKRMQQLDAPVGGASPCFEQLLVDRLFAGCWFEIVRCMVDQ
jgi:hypothetical protein